VSGPRRELKYRFGPVPVWVFDAYSDGTLSDERFVVLTFLFRLAGTSALASRGETPTVSLDTFAERVRWASALPSLSHLFNQMRADGQLDYHVAGNPKTGYRYVFRLYPEGPRRSDLDPTSEGADETGGTDASKTPSEERDPTSTSPDPTSEAAAEPLTDGDDGSSPDVADPTSLDVRENPNPSLGEDPLGGTSRNNDDVEEEPETNTTNGRVQTESGLIVPESVAATLPGMEPEMNPAPEDRL
jgi:hypothetical protein